MCDGWILNLNKDLKKPSEQKAQHQRQKQKPVPLATTLKEEADKALKGN